MCYIVFISHSLHWRYIIKTALQEYVIKEVKGKNVVLLNAAAVQLIKQEARSRENINSIFLGELTILFNFQM